MVTTFWLYRDVNGSWRWTLEAANGRKIANAGEGYINRDDCVHAVNLVMDTTHTTAFRER